MPATRPSSWTLFRRDDLADVVRIVGEVAASGDPGAFGHGVEVVVESPPLRWWQRGAARDAEASEGLEQHAGERVDRDQARIAVTGENGRVAYPVQVRLLTGHGVAAVRRVERREGWATSVTALAPSAPRGSLVPAGHPYEHGEALLVLKRGARTSFDPVELVEGAVAALDDLHPFSRTRGWRVRVDRDVHRS